MCYRRHRHRPPSLFSTASAIMAPTSPRSSVISSRLVRERAIVLLHLLPQAIHQLVELGSRGAALSQRLARVHQLGHLGADPAVGDAPRDERLAHALERAVLAEASTTAFSASMDSRCTTATSASSTPPAMVARNLFMREEDAETA